MNHFEARRMFLSHKVDSKVLRMASKSILMRKKKMATVILQILNFFLRNEF